MDLYGGGRAIARYGSTVGINEVTDDGQRTTVDDRRIEGLGILDFWGIVGMRGTGCSTCEGELRAIARYGSTVGISARWRVEWICMVGGKRWVEGVVIFLKTIREWHIFC